MSNTEEEEVPETPIEEPKDGSFSISDYIKKNVTLPRGTATMYLDGETAWEYLELSEKQNEIIRQQGVLQNRVEALKSSGPSGITGSTASSGHADKIESLDSEYEDLDTQKRALNEKLAASAVEVNMRAMYPKELKIAGEKGERIAVTKNKTDEQAELAKATVTNALFLSASVISMTYPGGRVVNGPIEHKEFLALEDYVEKAEYDKVMALMNKLNTRAAIRDAQADAGFPGGRSESPGE